MIFDCFLFFNELDLLEFRLNYLQDIVDWFVVIEGTHNFQGNPQLLPTLFEKNKGKFSKFQIKHAIAQLSANPPHSFFNEVVQRDLMVDVLKELKAQAEDVIIFGDVDEIPKKELIRSVDRPFTLMQEYYKYDKNHRVYSKFTGVAEEWPGTVLLPYSQFDFPEIVRYKRFLNTKIPNGGWHYSWFGGDAAVLEKLSATSHNDLNTQENQDLPRFHDLLSKGIDPLDQDKIFK